MKVKNSLKIILVILAILIVDQISKIGIKTTMCYGQEIPIFGSWFKLHFIENPGMAFGMRFPGMAIFGKVFLACLSIKINKRFVLQKQFLCEFAKNPEN